MNPSPPPSTTTLTTLLLKKDLTLTNKRYITLLTLNYLALCIGSISSSLLAKFYFIHNGSSRWVSTWVQCAGFPLLLVPIFAPYLTSFTNRKPFTNINKQLITLSIGVGLGLGLNNLLFSWGTSYLPVSTSSLLLSTQLVFTLILSCLIVKQKITFLNLNCVVLLTLSSILLAITSSHDLPKDISKAKYLIGYSCTIGAGFIFAIYLPIMEKVYGIDKSSHTENQHTSLVKFLHITNWNVSCYEMVMEMQVVMEIAATILATIGMASDGGFGEMIRESTRDFDLGPRMYWVTVVATVVSWQLCFMGTAGMVFLTTSLTSAVCMSALLAMNVLSGVAVYGDHFSGAKVVCTLLFGWGFCSYVYGMYVQLKKDEIKDGSDLDDIKDGSDLNDCRKKLVNKGQKDHETEMTQIVTDGV